MNEDPLHRIVQTLASKEPEILRCIIELLMPENRGLLLEELIDRLMAVVDNKEWIESVRERLLKIKSLLDEPAH